MFRILIAVLASAGLVAMVGCRRASEKLSAKIIEKAIEKNSGGEAKVDIKNGKVSVRTKDGEFESTTGGEAKMRIQGGEVRVNGFQETRRGRKLKPGDRVELAGQTVVVTDSL